MAALLREMLSSALAELLARSLLPGQNPVSFVAVWREEKVHSVQ